MRVIIGLGLAIVLAGAAGAQAVPTEISRLSGSKITLHVHPFLTEAELVTLRLVASNKDALKLFVTSNKGYAAIAVAPGEGFLRDGMPVASAFAIAELPDAETALAEALKGCDAARNGGEACVVVLEIGPGR